MLLQEQRDVGSIDVHQELLPFFGFCLKRAHPFVDFIVVLAFGIINEELLKELWVGDVSKALIILLLFLLQSLLVVVVKAGSAKHDEGDDERKPQQASPNGGFLLLLLSWRSGALFLVAFILSSRHLE